MSSLRRKVRRIWPYASSKGARSLSPSVAGERSTQHIGTEHLAIHNTFIRRLLVLLSLKTTAQLHSWMGFCVPITRNMIVKTGPYVHLNEGATMLFIAKHTSSIPVPKVYCSFIHKNRAYIVMERIRGDELPTAWKVLSEESRQKVLDQLRDMVREMRALKRPPSEMGVESCVGGSLRDSRLPRSRPRFGPFKTTRDFHLWLRDGFQLSQSQVEDRESNSDWLDVQDMIATQDKSCPHPPVFTHGDLTPFNVLLRGDRVVGLIDWEFSGWYPYYWEYTSAWFGSMTKTEWQQDSIPKFLEEFPVERKMEETRHKWWGEF